MVENLPNVSKLWQPNKFIVTVCFKNNFRKREKQSWCLRLDASVICPAADHGTAHVLIRVPALLLSDARNWYCIGLLRLGAV